MTFDILFCLFVFVFILFPIVVFLPVFVDNLEVNLGKSVKTKNPIPNEKQILQSEILRLTSELDRSRIELSKYKGYRG